MSAYVDRTLALVYRLHESFGCVRAVIQAYLYRSQSDIETLCRQQIPVRLCKGAYKEPSDIAYPEKSDVDKNYVSLMTTLLDHGPYPAIASHDGKIADRALQLVRERKSLRIVLNFRCSMESIGSCRSAWWTRDSVCVCTSRMETPGIHTLCAGWPSGRPTWFSWYETC